MLDVCGYNHGTNVLKNWKYHGKLIQGILYISPNMAMEHLPFAVDVPLKPPFTEDFQLPRLIASIKPDSIIPILMYNPITYGGFLK